jgi:pyruvate dehydrogenase E1 component
MGDGEMDEPESLGAVSLAGRERLDNLIFVLNCNLQRLDGPVCWEHPLCRREAIRR